MDPNTTLKEMLELSDKIGAESEDQDADRLAELVYALHGWVSTGGFLPDQWQQTRCAQCKGRNQ